MDQETAEEVRHKIEEIAEDEGIELDSVILFGSRSRDDYREKSDADVVLISEDFEDVNWFKRPKQFYLGWDYDDLPSPEFLCYTPLEFEERKRRKGDIARTADKEGVRLA
jgi:predicted nucleotidyltransferase